MLERLSLVEAERILSESFKKNDIRGIVGDTLTEHSAYCIGAAFVDVLNLADKSVAIGYDMRESSPVLAQAFAKGVKARGAIAVMIGQCSTDMLYFASGYLNSAAAMFTASHNPAEWNGIKLSKANAKSISGEDGLDEIRELTKSYLVNGFPEVKVPYPFEHRELIKEYAEKVRSIGDFSSTTKSLKIVVDAGNGMAGYTVPAVFGNSVGLEALPFEIIPMYFELDGTFPNHEANPLDPKNLVDLQKAVVEHNADLGLAFDGDADRCFIVDENGDPVSPSAISIIIALKEIARHANEKTTVLHNVLTSKYFDEAIKLNTNANVIKTEVGHSMIKKIMASSNAVFGGEHSAHYYFRDFWGADSGIIAAVHTISELLATGKTMSELSNQYNPYFMSGEINNKVANAKELIQMMSEIYASNDKEYLDGVTVHGSEGADWWWFNLRSSNTEPLLRLNVESSSRYVMEVIRDEVLELINENGDFDVN